MAAIAERTAAGAFAGLFVAALALRPQIIAIGPLLPEIQDDLHLSHFAAGLLATIPVLCMGAFAPWAGALVHRHGTRAVVGGSLGLIAAFGVLRALVPGAAALVLLTVPVGIGMAVAQTVLPVVVKELLPGRPAFATGVYATGMQVGVAGGAAVAVPLSLALGGWPGPLVVISVLTAAVAAVWLWLTPREARGIPTARPRLPVRSRLAWVLALAFGLQSMVFYGLGAWLVPAYVERGWSADEGGLLLTVFALVAIPSGFVVLWLADRAGTRRLYLVLASATLTTGAVGFVLAPGGAWAWAVLTGAAGGVMLPLLLTLPVDAATDPREVGALAALMLLGGYLLSALSPVLLGTVRDATGGFTASLWLIAGFAAALCAISAMLTPRRLAALA